MTNTEQEECASKKPWREILNGWAKKAVWKSADGAGEEGGRWGTRIILIAITGFILLWLLGSAYDQFVNAFGGWFDWIPNPFSWFSGDEAKDVAASKPVVAATPPVDESTCSLWGRNVPAWATKCK